jgi:hypothetical protein
MRKHPIVYEINTWVWLTDLSRQYGTTITLGNIPTDVLDDLQSWGFDAIWLMGVWQRSPFGRKIALEHPGLRTDYDRVLPGWQPADVAGSPYAVYRYEVDSFLGGRDGLAVLREQLRSRGIGLLLDYVPNHTAVDHAWTIECPDVYVQGTDADLRAHPHAFFRANDDTVIAHGRDPYFPAWTDTAQVNAFSSAARQMTIGTLQDIATQCDGVRCDMAMLLVTRIFASTWGTTVGYPPDQEFWAGVTTTVRAQHSSFLFMAEVYWDMESDLQQLGFDYTYDKRLYDRLRHETAASVRDHLLAPLAYQTRMVRFTENHDEVRAAIGFGEAAGQAAITLSALLPGMTLFHEGQFEGRRLKLPVQLGKRPSEAASAHTVSFYRDLLRELQQPHYHQGVFMKLGTLPSVGEDRDHEQWICFAWVWQGELRIVVVNLADRPTDGRVMIPNQAFAGEARLVFVDLLSVGREIAVSGDELLMNGLTLGLAPYGKAIFAIKRG